MQAQWGQLKTDVSRGILPSQQIKKLLENNIIHAPALTQTSIQPSSLDLRLGKKGYRVPAAFLTMNGTSVQERLDEFEKLYYTLDLSKPTFLEARKAYVFELQESIHFPFSMQAKSNPKSSTGRVDTFARLIADGTQNFDIIPAGYSGKLYLLVFPISFDLVIEEGIALNQIRIQAHGSKMLNTQELFEMNQKYQILFDKDGKPIPLNDHFIHSNGLHLSIDLSDPIVGYKSKKNAPPINLAKMYHYEISDYWDPIKRPANKRLILDPDFFYILKSKELIRIPTAYAAEIIDFHSGIGEFRSHYAGFFDPGFGYGKKGELKGAVTVFEARCRDTPMEVEDGQVFCKFVFEKMSEIPEIAYGVEIKSNYQSQNSVRLAKQFKYV
ncbi:MAG: 2'-deoxycytidine 5'-triphosphate deaminase [Nanoarchaeota archaeon]